LELYLYQSIQWLQHKESNSWENTLHIYTFSGGKCSKWDEYNKQWKSKSCAVDQRLDIVHLTFFVACKKRSADQRNTKIMELEGFGSRKRTIYFVKRT
jgi:hypothetical protein